MKSSHEVREIYERIKVKKKIKIKRQAGPRFWVRSLMLSMMPRGVYSAPTKALFHFTWFSVFTKALTWSFYFNNVKCLFSPF